jgi:ABC-type sugar transport system ATPase subunit
MTQKNTDVADQLAIHTSGLTKSYGGRTVVDLLDVALPRGVQAGFVGPNGAGKSTTLRMLLGLVRPTAGSGTVLGSPLERPGAYLLRVGALIEAPAFYPGLTGTANLQVMTTLGGIDNGLDPQSSSAGAVLPCQLALLLACVLEAAARDSPEVVQPDGKVPLDPLALQLFEQVPNRLAGPLLVVIPWGIGEDLADKGLGDFPPTGRVCLFQHLGQAGTCADTTGGIAFSAGKSHQSVTVGDRRRRVRKKLSRCTVVPLWPQQRLP